jgi:hypothetical protein
MPRRLHWGRIAALGVLSLVVCGSALAGALSHTGAGRGRKATKCGSFKGEGGPLVGPIKIRSGTPPVTFAEYGVGFSCNGAVSRFSITTDKPFVSRSVTRANAIEDFVVGGVPGYESVFCRQKGTRTFRCRFAAPKRSPRHVHITANFFSSAGCSTPIFSARVNVIRRANPVATKCLSG